MAIPVGNTEHDSFDVVENNSSSYLTTQFRRTAAKIAAFPAFMPPSENSDVNVRERPPLRWLSLIRQIDRGALTFQFNGDCMAESCDAQ